MKKSLIPLLSMLLLFQLAFPSGYDYEKSEIISKVLVLKQKPEQSVLYIEILGGSITAEGYRGSEIKIEATKTVYSKKQSDLDEAFEAIAFEIVELEHGYFIYLKTPNTIFEREELNIRYEDCNRYDHYRYVCDFIIKVPEELELHLTTVLDGEVYANNIKGLLSAKNVNGSVKLDHIGNLLEASTVNGDVDILFSKNPENDMKISTINGDITLNFLRGLSADFEVETMNGDVYTDFEDISFVPSIPVKKEGKDGMKKIYKISSTPVIRIGNGGSYVNLSNINGDFILAQQ